jgi:hypothetical protein
LIYFFVKEGLYGKKVASSHHACDSCLVINSWLHVACYHQPKPVSQQRTYDNTIGYIIAFYRSYADGNAYDNTAGNVYTRRTTC